MVKYSWSFKNLSSIEVYIILHIQLIVNTTMKTILVIFKLWWLHSNLASANSLSSSSLKNHFDSCLVSESGFSYSGSDRCSLLSGCIFNKNWLLSDENKIRCSLILKNKPKENRERTMNFYSCFLTVPCSIIIFLNKDQGTLFFQSMIKMLFFVVLRAYSMYAFCDFLWFWFVSIISESLTCDSCYF